MLTNLFYTTVSASNWHKQLMLSKRETAQVLNELVITPTLKDLADPSLPQYVNIAAVKKTSLYLLATENRFFSYIYTQSN